MNKKIDIKTITGTSLLSALVIIFQVIGNLVTIVPTVCLNLSLVVIAIGAIVFGPYVGAFLGFIDGLVILFAPSTASVFFSISPIGTILTCLIKTTLAGFISGLIYRLFKDKHQNVGAIIASLLVPLINTLVFSGMVFIFFSEILKTTDMQNAFPNLFLALILGVLGWNFVFEFSVTAILSPSIIRIMRIQRKKRI